MKDRTCQETEKTTIEQNKRELTWTGFGGGRRLRVEDEVEVEVEKKRVGSKSEIRRSGSPQ